MSNSGVDHESNPLIAEAARWLVATSRDGRGGPAVPAIKGRFGLSAREAVEAIREANLIRARAH